MMSIDFSPEDYIVIKTQKMDDRLEFKLIKFHTGYYGVMSHDPLTDKEEIILISPKKDKKDDFASIFGGWGCRSYLLFARDANNYYKHSAIELVVKLGHDAPEEYREIITRDQAETLHEKLEICYEIMQMKMENSFAYKYGDDIMTIFELIILATSIFLIHQLLHAMGVM